MANFDMAELALKSVCPNNAMKYDDKEMPSVMVFMHQYETWARYNTEIGCLLGKYIASVKK